MSLSQCRVLYTLGITIINIELMIYAYIRVSSDKQTTENQRYELQRFAMHERLHIDRWIEETVSGGRNYRERELGALLDQVGEGDMILCSELSRLGRSLFMVMDILSLCMQRRCTVWTVKDGYRLGEDVTSKVLAFAFALSAEIERKLIAQRTRDALARLRAQGRRLGRPRGSQGKHLKLSGCEAEICHLLALGKTKSAIAQSLGVSIPTLRLFIQRYQLMPESSPQDSVGRIKEHFSFT